MCVPIRSTMKKTAATQEGDDGNDSARPLNTHIHTYNGSDTAASQPARPSRSGKYTHIQSAYACTEVSLITHTHTHIHTHT